MVLIINPFSNDNHLQELVEIGNPVEDIEVSVDDLVEQFKNLRVENKNLNIKVKATAAQEKSNWEIIKELKTALNFHETQIINLQNAELSYFCDYSSFYNISNNKFFQLKKKP